jgi:aryl-alcohol dehydrogenase
MRDSAARVPKPVVLGHEGAGVVERVGRAVRKVKPGDHVVMTFDSCGHCPSCYKGDAAYCTANAKHNFGGQRQDGSTALSCGDEHIHSHFFGQSSFATHAICTERNVVAVDPDVPLELLGPLGCGIQTGAGAVLHSLRVGAGSSIAVFGTGSVGLAGVMAARLAGAAVIIAVDTQDARLEAAREMGATHVFNPAREDVFGAIAAALPGGMDFVLDTSGHLETIRRAVMGMAPRGVCGLVNSAKGADVPLNILNLMLGGRSVRGIHQGDSVPEIFIPQMIALYRQGRFPFDRLVQFYALDQINEAMADMASGRAIKPVIRMPATA